MLYAEKQRNTTIAHLKSSLFGMVFWSDLQFISIFKHVVFKLWHPKTFHITSTGSSSRVFQILMFLNVFEKR